MRTSLVSRVAFWLAAGCSLAVAHDAVFLAQLGPGHELAAALRSAGHGYWGAAAFLLLLGGAAAAVAWLVRIRSLRRRAVVPRATVDGPSWRRRAVGHWIRLFAVVAISFVLQENLEHAFAHGHLIGLGALIGPEYPLAVPVLALVTGAAAAIIAIARQHEIELISRIPASPAGARRSNLVVRWNQDPRRVRHAGPMSVHRGLRAPPSPIHLVHI